MSFQVLDTLVNAPSSVAGMYADLVYLMGFDRERIVEPLRATLDTLEQRGWVVARMAPPNEGGGLRLASRGDRDWCWLEYAVWLPKATRDDLAADEIGLWYGITESGRDAWQTVGADAEAELWELDEDAERHTVSIIAGSEEAAERRLSEWLLRRPDIAVTSKELSTVVGLKFRSGRTLLSGVRLISGYTLRGT